jgi:hypothetical protein
MTGRAIIPPTDLTDRTSVPSLRAWDHIPATSFPNEICFALLICAITTYFYIEYCKIHKGTIDLASHDYNRPILAQSAGFVQLTALLNREMNH